MFGQYDPLEEARKTVSRGGNSSSRASFFSLRDGETKYLRFLTSMRKMVVVSHECGLSNYEFLADEFDQAQQAGGIVCPKCGKPITQADVLGTRPEVQVAYMHRWFKTAEPNGHANFTCLEHDGNAMMGLVPANPDGTHMYSCPVCASQENLNANGTPRRPSLRMYGAAVERDVEMQMVPNENGIPVPTIVRAEDVMETGDDGIVRPKVVIVEMGYYSFWSKLDEIDKTGKASLAYYDFQVTRTGAGLDTTYQVTNVTGMSTPNPLDFNRYRELIPDVSGIAKRAGTPEHYVKCGYPVIGYTQVQQEPQQAYQPAYQQQGYAPQQAQQPQQQPYQPQAQPYADPFARAYDAPYGAQPQQQQQPQPQYGATSDWDDIASQLRANNA